MVSMVNGPGLNANQVRITFKVSNTFVNVPTVVGANLTFPLTNKEGGSLYPKLSLQGTFLDADTIQGTLQYYPGVGDPVENWTYTMNRL